MLFGVRAVVVLVLLVQAMQPLEEPGMVQELKDVCLHVNTCSKNKPHKPWKRC